MAATTISRSVWTDGVGTGTVIANARLQGDVYDKIDSLIGANIIFGGTISSEGFGTHALSVGGTGGNTLQVRNTSAGTGNFGRVQAQGDGSGFCSLDMASSTFTTSGGLVASGGRVVCTGTGGMAIETSASSGIRLVTDNVQRAVVNSSGVVAENTFAVGVKNTAGTVIPALTISGANAMSMGSDSAASVGELTIAAGGAIRFRMNSAERIVMTSAGAIQAPNGGVSTPTYGFSSDTDAGFTYETSVYNAPAVAHNGGLHTSFKQTGSGPKTLEVYHASFGTGAIIGNSVRVGRNDSGNGAAGHLVLEDKNAVQRPMWVDASGNVRIHSGPPTEDGTTSDTAGTVVGAQSSSRDSKDVLGLFIDRPVALRTVLDTPLYRWRYKNDAFQGEEFMGIITDDSPAFGMDRDEDHPGGKSLNVPNAIGLLVASVQELQLQINALRKS
jgi:hypothetical protein